MYLPRPLLAHLYTSLLTRIHPLSPPVLVLVSLTPDALCAARILTALLKRDYIPHKVQPVAGYAELTSAGERLVCPLARQRGGEGGVVVCLGVGGMVDLEETLGLERCRTEGEEQGLGRDHGVEVWCLDGRRPWNLQNVFGGVQEGENVRGVERGRIERTYQAGKGGVVVFDDGDIELELEGERQAFCELVKIPELGTDELDDESQSVDEEDENHDEGSGSRKRKSISGEDGSDIESESEERARRRRRSNSGSSIPSSPSEERTRRETFALSNHPSRSDGQSESPVPSSPPAQQPSAQTLRRRLLKLRRKYETVLSAYYSLGTSYAEPVSSLVYNLAEELGREDNDLLWLAIVGVTSVNLYSSSQTPSSIARTSRINSVLRDEVRRLNPLPPSEIPLSRPDESIPTTARSPTDTAIRISPEPRFLLTRHWSLYESMLHSPYLSSRLHIWTDAGRKRLDRLLTKMGVSLDEARKGYTHMDMELKRTLRQRLLKFAPMYNLDGLVPPAQGPRSAPDKDAWSFVRCWGWRACLSASDVATIVSAILEVGAEPGFALTTSSLTDPRRDGHKLVLGGYGARMMRASLPTPEASPNAVTAAADNEKITDPDFTTNRFYAAFDALAPGSKGLDLLLAHIDTAKHLHAAILRTGSALMAKHQIRHLRAFRMAVVRDGPDLQLFCHPGALVKLADWVGEAVGVLEAERTGKGERGPLVLGCVDEPRGVFVVVGVGGGGGGVAKVRSRAEAREREERRRKRKDEREARRVAERRKREERRRRKRERDEANGIFRDDDEERDSSDETESEAEEEEEESSESDDSDEDEELVERRKRRGFGLNRFGAAFQKVVEESGARVRIDSFEHSVVEVKKEDFSGFLEALSLKTVVG